MQVQMYMIPRHTVVSSRLDAQTKKKQPPLKKSTNLSNALESQHKANSVTSDFEISIFCPKFRVSMCDINIKPNTVEEDL